MKTKDKKQSISKDDFLKFLSYATPEDINKYLLEKGKCMKLIEPIIFFKENDKKRK